MASAAGSSVSQTHLIPQPMNDSAKNNNISQWDEHLWCYMMPDEAILTLPTILQSQRSIAIERPQFQELIPTTLYYIIVNCNYEIGAPPFNSDHQHETCCVIIDHVVNWSVVHKWDPEIPLLAMLTKLLLHKEFLTSRTVAHFIQLAYIEYEDDEVSILQLLFFISYLHRRRESPDGFFEPPTIQGSMMEPRLATFIPEWCQLMECTAAGVDTTISWSLFISDQRAAINLAKSQPSQTARGRQR
ncbi:hypothetical protein AB5N19_06762 [Seiridium cardinale]|uniref:Uncharacterized protein n=1 Tax=Seiridium cardinale TaxID=138064 RepID=A0ABR2XKW6_9PEZI